MDNNNNTNDVLNFIQHILNGSVGAAADFLQGVGNWFGNIYQTLAANSNGAEWAYTLIGVLASIVTWLALRIDREDLRFQRDKAKEGALNKGEVLVARMDVWRDSFGLVAQMIVVVLGVCALFAPPASPQAPVTLLGIIFAVGLSLLEITLASKAVFVLVGSRQHTALATQEADEQLARLRRNGEGLGCITVCPRCGYEAHDTVEAKEASGKGGGDSGTGN